jgi:hypothetical protein
MSANMPKADKHAECWQKVMLNASQHAQCWKTCPELTNMPNAGKE